MASDQTALVGPFAIATVSLSATAANSTAIIGPAWASQATITFLQSGGTADTGKVASDGTDGLAIDADYFPIASGAAFSWSVKATTQIGGPNPVFYVTGGTNSALCHVLFEEARA